jgi:hypothetical protein
LVLALLSISLNLITHPCSACSLIGNPYNDPNIKGDPYKTLFVSNLVSESQR